MVKYRLSFVKQTAIVILSLLVLGVTLFGFGFLYVLINVGSSEFIPVLPTEIGSSWHFFQLVLLIVTLVFAWYIRPTVEDRLTLKLFSPDVHTGVVMIFPPGDSLDIVATDAAWELQAGYLRLLQAGSQSSMQMTMSGTMPPHGINLESVAASG